MIDAQRPSRLTILMPMFEDWECAQMLIRKLDELSLGIADDIRVVLVDDGSNTAPPQPFVHGPLQHISRLDRLQLRRNLGHQRAIAVGLSHLFEEAACAAVVVMDADGEDRVEDVPRLMGRFLELNGKVAVFAARTRRSENRIFRLGYRAYRHLHWILTGIPVRIGNFSILAREHLSTLVVVSDLWNHYAASVVKSRIPFETISTHRGVRLAGKSKLNLISLILHGLSAISVFAELVGVRMLLAIGAGALLFVAMLVSLAGVCYGTDMTPPGWAVPLVALILILFLQVFTVAAGLTLAILIKRDTLSFLPIRDYRFFVGSVTPLYVREK